MQDRVLALIPAAGQGRRFGAPVEKQFLSLGGKPLLTRTVEPFQRSPWVHGIVLVVPVGSEKRTWESVVRPHGLLKVSHVVQGGPQRQDSVRLGLEAAGPNWGLVLIHDGARPLVTEEIIARCVQETLLHGATLVGVPATDTIKEVDAQGTVLNTLTRERLWMVQTPQGFRHALILRAHEEAHAEGFLGTDDAALVERLGASVKVIHGSYDNIKITTQRDLALAEEILVQRERGVTP
jgi:2-C-methyl-D-erythritol 4-phosphate cytidylyltransferase